MLRTRRIFYVDVGASGQDQANKIIDDFKKKIQQQDIDNGGVKYETYFIPAAYTELKFIDVIDPTSPTNEGVNQKGPVLLEEGKK